MSSTLYIKRFSACILLAYAAFEGGRLLFAADFLGVLFLFVLTGWGIRHIARS